MLPTVLRYACAILLIAMCARLGAGNELVFDSFNGVDRGGGTSPNLGAGQQIVVDHDIVISNIGELNRMQTAGQLIFHIWDATSSTKLFETNVATFGPDVGSDPTWKISDNFRFTLQTGKHYVVGATSNVSRFTVFDTVPESQNGITSEMVLWVSIGFPSTSIDTFIHGGDSAIRLYAVPEPASSILAALSFVFFGWRQRIGVASQVNSGAHM